MSLPVDPKTLPDDAEKLKKIVVDVTAQLDRTERLRIRSGVDAATLRIVLNILREWR